MLNFPWKKIPVGVRFIILLSIIIALIYPKFVKWAFQEEQIIYSDPLDLSVTARELSESERDLLQIVDMKLYVQKKTLEIQIRFLRNEIQRLAQGNHIPHVIVYGGAKIFTATGELIIETEEEFKKLESPKK